MRTRITRALMGLAAIAALAFGGSALANAATNKVDTATEPAPAPASQGVAPGATSTGAETPDPGENAGGPDTDNVQEGPGNTAADANDKAGATETPDPGEKAAGPDTDTLQEGPQ